LGVLLPGGFVPLRIFHCSLKMLSWLLRALLLESFMGSRLLDFVPGGRLGPLDSGRNEPFSLFRLALLNVRQLPRVTGLPGNTLLPPLFFRLRMVTL
jgi:hypothetical protein